MDNAFNIEDDPDATVQELRAELVDMRNRVNAATQALENERLHHRGWRYNADHLFQDRTNLMNHLRKTLQRVAEFLRFFGPMPFDQYDEKDWQVESDYFPDYDLGLEFAMQEHAPGADHAFWQGVFRTREELGHLRHQ
jgi:hypothetical protein